MSILSWLRGDIDTVEEIEARLPGQPEPEGELVVDSPTWIYVRNWAQKQLLELRVNNDRLGLGEVGTAALRGEIKCLKKLIDLPAEKPRAISRRGILEDDDGY